MNYKVCGAQVPSESAWDSPGQNRSESPGAGAKCQEGSPNNKKCMDSCVENAIKGSRPNYNALNISAIGQNCHGWAASTLQSCAKQCGGQ